MSDDDRAAELAAALAAFVILSPSAFSFANEAPINAESTPMAPGWGDADRLVGAIQATLYDRCYARRSGVASAAAGGADPDFARRLAQANAGRERWDKGWMIHQLGPNGQVFIRKGERERAAMPGAFIAESALGMAPQIGAQVSIRAPREALDVQPGYYFAFGEALDELADQLSLVRFYFHCDAESVFPLVAELTVALNVFQVPFQLKAPTDARLYGRTDAAVLYAGARYYTIIVRIIAGLRDAVRLDPSVPLFTRHLWPGIGAAVEPGSGDSFGTHRCRLVAQGMVDAWREGRQDVPGRLAAVAARFAASGLDLARPYLGPGGVDLFQPPAPARLP
ncbi:MAG: T3SS effector HopA1 family protein [Acetobacteraceae bacterium]